MDGVPNSMYINRPHLYTYVPDINITILISSQHIPSLVVC